MSRVLDRAMTEDELLQAVTDALTLYGWLWHHVRRSDKALQMGMAGFPDICAVHPKDGRLLFVECKAQKGQVSAEQWRWFDALRKNLRSFALYPALRPADLDSFLRDDYVGGR